MIRYIFAQIKAASKDFLWQHCAVLLGCDSFRFFVTILFDSSNVVFIPYSSWRKIVSNLHNLIASPLITENLLPLSVVPKSETPSGNRTRHSKCRPMYVWGSKQSAGQSPQDIFSGFFDSIRTFYNQQRTFCKALRMNKQHSPGEHFRPKAVGNGRMEWKTIYAKWKKKPKQEHSPLWKIEDGRHWVSSPSFLLRPPQIGPAAS